MLKFLVFEDGRASTDWSSRGAYLLGPDDIGAHGNISFEDGLITCEKNAAGATALAVEFSISEIGELVLQTCLLPDRDEPYHLTVELARHRLMKVLAKQEDWTLFGLEESHPVSPRLKIAKQKFIEALGCTDNPAMADKFARESLIFAIDASEELALAHTNVMQKKFRESENRMRNKFGCGVGLDQDIESMSTILLEHFDYVRLPTPWRHLEPEEEEYNWDGLDAWCTLAFLNHMPIIAGPVVSFDPVHVPEWLYVWQHDYDTIRDLLYEHVKKVMARYRNVVSLWNVVSGLYVNGRFGFNVEQLMDLTRMAVVLTKQIQPNAKTLIEITHPFGEYHAHNPASLPPLTYAEMAIQAGIPFDGFGLKLLMGESSDGRHTRDLMQLSSLLDRFLNLGKPVHVTAVAVPSSKVEPANPEEMVDSNGEIPGGYWRKPWSPSVQGRWLEAFYSIAFSKPVVESVAWLDLADHDDAEIAHGGLLKSNLEPKKAFQRLTTLRRTFHDQENGNGR
jgi:hypothetical protein